MSDAELERGQLVVGRRITKAGQTVFIAAANGRVIELTAQGARNLAELLTEAADVVDVARERPN